MVLADAREGGREGGEEEEGERREEGDLPRRARAARLKGGGAGM